MIIFSVEKSNYSARDNAFSNEEAVQILGENGSYQTLTGVYQGQKETSYLTSQVELGRELAAAFKQDCYLERGHYGYWYLIETKSGKILRTFKTIKEVDKDKALSSEYYTLLNGKYYIGSDY